MVYIGYPVNIEEALRLFNLTFNEQLKSPYHYDVQTRDFINREINKFGINYYILDKNLHVIGFDLDNKLGDFSKNHI